MSEAMPLQPEQSFARGRFVLVNRLGRGGMGEVWLARDERLREPVALKFLPPEIRGDAGALDDLCRETARSHKLSHANIVRIHDLYEDPDGMAFIVMEYIDGATLAALRLQQPSRVLSWEYLRPLVAQLCAALEYAHGEKVIHRDLKPANLMVDSRGRLKLADFGIAAVASDSMSRISMRHSTSGTLPYMSPQQLTGQRPQAADDIYALGATLYELLTGKPPFHTGDITHQVLHQAPEPMEDRLAELGMPNDIPPDAAALVMACLAKEPGQRPQSARAVAEWIGLELEAKPSAESLAAALFPDTPASSAGVAGQLAEEGRSTPAVDGTPPIRPRRLEAGKGSLLSGHGRTLAAVGIMLLVLGGAFWLGKGTRRGDRSNSPVAAKALDQTSESAAVPVTPFDTRAADAPELKYGLYIHFGMDTFRHAGEKGQLPVERFAPPGVNVKAWARVAKEAGMTFAVLTAKHDGTGFCMWDSKDCAYDIAHSPYKGDILADYIAACKAEHLVPGFHYSIPDAYNEGSPKFKGAVMPPYFNIIKQHITELNTKYPDLRILILDVSTRLSPAQFDELSQIVERLNPPCAVWASDGVSGPHHSDGTVIPSWMWSANAKLNPAQKLLNAYQQAQAAGKAFVLNVGPDPSGNIPEDQIAVLKQLKDLIASSSPATPAAQPPSRGTVPNPAASHEPGWISSQVPKPGADGWIVLFDGKRLYGCSPPAADIASGKVSIQDGCLRLDTITLDFNLIGRDVAIRARLKKASGANCDFAARNDGKNNGKGRDCEGCFNQANNFFLGHHVDQQWRSVMTVRPQGNYLAFFEMEFRAEGENLTLKADGQDICHTRENSIMEAGTIAVRSLDGITLYQSIEAQLLDKR
jgi:hypothetical protein